MGFNYVGLDERLPEILECTDAENHFHPIWSVPVRVRPLFRPKRHCNDVLIQLTLHERTEYLSPFIEQ